MDSEYFIDGEQYVFDKALYAKTMKMSMQELPSWACDCDGAIVTPISDMEARYHQYRFVRSWCMTLQEYQEMCDGTNDTHDVCQDGKDSIDRHLGCMTGLFILGILVGVVIQILING